jgi:hypothetical protein
MSEPCPAECCLLLPAECPAHHADASDQCACHLIHSLTFLLSFTVPLHPTIYGPFAAPAQSALAKERRELQQQQQRTLLEAIPKDLSRPWEDPMPEEGERHLAAVSWAGPAALACFVACLMHSSTTMPWEDPMPEEGERHLAAVSWF